MSVTRVTRSRLVIAGFASWFRRSRSRRRATILAVAASGVLLVSSSNVYAQDDAVSNLVATAELRYSTDGGANYTSQPPIIAPTQRASVWMKLDFQHAGSDGRDEESEPYTSLTFRHDRFALATVIALALNEHHVPLPLEGMDYQSVPGIDPGLLQEGKNTLLVKYNVRNRARDRDLEFAPAISLTPLERDDLEFQTGPLLGAFGKEFFTVTGRTNMPARVSVFPWDDAEDTGAPAMEALEGTEPLTVTELGLVHRLRVPRVSSLEPGHFAVIAERDGKAVGGVLRVPTQPDKQFTFLVLGDSRTNVSVWEAVASAAADAAGDATMVVHVGDMVTLGTRDWEWDTQFWQPGRVLLDDLPVYPVIGNHEANAPLFDVLFFGPGEGGEVRNWAQEMSGVLLVGIDGAQDWTEESDNVAWLEEVLRRSEARFTFVFSHYPAWSSAGHGRLNEAGIPRERPSREARHVIVPLLARHGATAYLAGHDHAYERSELLGEVTGITCGGAGAPLYEKTDDAARQNPYSEVFAARHHFCLFDIDHEAATMRVLSVDGELIDSRTWHARN